MMGPMRPGALTSPLSPDEEERECVFQICRSTRGRTAVPCDVLVWLVRCFRYLVDEYTRIGKRVCDASRVPRALQ